jgi:SRSO17 transposase
MGDGERKSAEPMAARACPDRDLVDSAQRLAYFTRAAEWSDRDVAQGSSSLRPGGDDGSRAGVGLDHLLHQLSETRLRLETIFTMTREQLVRRVKGRWRTERVYDDARGDLGLDHYEGRGYRGGKHHVSVVLVCFAFFVAERVRSFPPSARKAATRQAVARVLVTWLPRCPLCHRPRLPSDDVIPTCRPGHVSTSRCGAVR